MADDPNQITGQRVVSNSNVFIRLDEIKQLHGNLTPEYISFLTKTIKRELFDDRGNFIPGKKLSVQTRTKNNVDQAAFEREVVITPQNGQDPHDVITLPDLVSFLSQATLVLRQQNPSALPGYAEGSRPELDQVIDWGQGQIMDGIERISIDELRQSNRYIKAFLDQVYKVALFQANDVEQEVVATNEDQTQTTPAEIARIATAVVAGISGASFMAQTDASDSKPDDRESEFKEETPDQKPNEILPSDQSRRRNKKLWLVQQNYVFKATAIILRDMFSEDDLKKMSVQELLDLKLKISGEVLALLNTEFNTQELYNDPSRVLLELRRAEQRSETLQNLATNLKTKIAGSEPHKPLTTAEEDIADTQQIIADDSSDELSANGHRIGLGPHETARTLNLAEHLISDHGENAYEVISSWSSEKLQSELEKFDVSTVGLTPKQVELLKRFTEANVLRETLAVMERSQKYSQRIEDTTERWENATPVERAQILDEANIRLDRTLINSDLPPIELITAATSSIVPVATPATVTAEPAKPSLTDTLVSVLGAETVSNLTSTVIEPQQQQQLNYAAQQIAFNTNSKTPEELSANVQKLVESSNQPWFQIGEEFTRLYNPNASNSQIQELLAQGPSLAFLMINSDPANLSKFMETARGSVSTSNQVWSRLQNDGTLVQYLQALYPNLKPLQIQELAKQKTADAAFSTQLLKHNNNIDDVTKAMNERRGSPADIWEKQLTPKQREALLLKVGTFASQEELNAFVESGLHLSFIAELLSDGKSVTAIGQIADNSKPTPEQLWAIASDAQKRDLALKVGADGSNPQLNIAIATAIQLNGDIDSVLSNSQLTTEKIALASDPAKQAEAQTIIKNLTPAEQESLLLGHGLNSQTLGAQRDSVLADIVSSLVALDGSELKIKRLAKEANVSAKAELTTAPEQTRALLSSLFNDQPDADQKVIAFIENNGGSSSEALRRAADITAVWAGMSNAEKAYFLRTAGNLSNDQITQKISNGDNAPPVELVFITDGGKNTTKINQYKRAATNDALAKWQGTTDTEKRRLLAKAGLPDVITSIPPAELFSEVATISFKATSVSGSATQMWQSLPAQLKIDFLKNKGFTDTQINTAIAEKTPPADWVSHAVENKFNTSQIINQLLNPKEQAAFVDRAKQVRKAVDQYRGAISNDKSVLDEESKLSQNANKKVVKEATGSKIRISYKLKTQLAMVGLIEQVLNDQQVPNSVKLQMFDNAGINSKRINLDTMSFEQRGLLVVQLSKMTDPGSMLDFLKKVSQKDFPILADNIQRLAKGEISLSDARRNLTPEESKAFDAYFSTDASKEAAVHLSAVFTHNDNRSTTLKKVLEQVELDRAIQAIDADLHKNYAQLQTGLESRTSEVVNFNVTYDEINEKLAELAERRIAAFEELEGKILQADIAAAEIDQLQQIIQELDTKLIIHQEYLQSIKNDWSELPTPSIALMAASDEAVQDNAIPDVDSQIESLPPEIQENIPESVQAPKTSFGRFREGLAQRTRNRFGSPARKRMLAAMRTTGQKLSGKLGKNAALRTIANFVGGPVAKVATVLTSKRGAQALAAGALLLPAPLMGSILGGMAGFAVGGPVGAAIGGTVGGGLGQLAQSAGYQSPLSFSSASAAPVANTGAAVSGGTTGSVAPQSLSNALNSKLAPNSIGSGGEGGAAAGQTPITSAISPQATTIGGQAAAPAASGALAAASGVVSTVVTIGIITPLLSMGLLIGLTIYFILVITGAFLVPIPTDSISTPTTTTSEYVTLTKNANSTKLANNPNNVSVTYTISIKPRKNYYLQLTEVRDTFSTQKGKGATDPVITDQGGTIIFPSAGLGGAASPVNLETFGTTPFNTPQEFSYTVIMNGGTDVSVKNSISLVFDVLEDGVVTHPSESENHRKSSIKIGNPKVLCWPNDGTVVQLPFGNLSHNTRAQHPSGIDLDAFDIIAPINTPIYSPVDGVVKDIPGYNGYGYHMIIAFDMNGSDSDGNESFLYFAHMPSVADMRFGIGDTVEAGEQIGVVGNSGASWSPHLHYELRTPTGGSILELVENGPSVYEGQRVTTCFGNT